MSDQTEIRHAIGANGTFVLRCLSGNIRLAGTDGDEAVVMVRTSRGAVPDLIVERSNGRLMVEPPRIGLAIMRRNDVELDFDIQLPRNARVDLKSVSAEVVSSGLAGEQDYKTVSGDIHLSGVAGRLTVQTVSGDLHINGGRRFELSATTTSGDLHLDGELFDYLRVRTVSGDVRLEGRLADGPRHTVETVSGDLLFRTSGGVTVEPARALDIGRNSRRPIVIGDGAASLSFRTMSGEERVTGSASDSKGARTPDYEPPTVVTRLATAPAAQAAPAATRLDVLRALERGDIDIEEAARRLEEVGADA